MKTSVFLGIGGTGMKGLAHLLRESGETVIGFDDATEVSEVSLEEARTALEQADRLIYTDAALPNHPLRELAASLKKQQLPYHKALGEFSRSYKTIAVTGTHGKSSTTSFLAHIFKEAGLSPTILVGASMPTLKGEHAEKGEGEYFIVEADEYRKHFLELSPAYVVITSIDFDHPDSFSSLQDVEAAYSEFISLLRPEGIVVTPQEEQEKHPGVVFPPSTLAVPASDAKDIRVMLPGIHMRMNGALAVALAEKLGIPKDDATQYLQSFPGLMRRFELLGTVNGCDIRSDYGHHPAEIAATLQGAKEVYPDSHIIAVFEAHMPLRLHTFFSDFVEAFLFADEVIITPPFVPAGRDSTAVEDVRKLTEQLAKKGKKATYMEEKAAFLSNLPENAVAILFSAGPLDAHIRKTLQQSQ